MQTPCLTRFTYNVTRFAVQVSIYLINSKTKGGGQLVREIVDNAFKERTSTSVDPTLPQNGEIIFRIN